LKLEFNELAEFLNQKFKEKFSEWTGKCKQYSSYVVCNCPLHPPDKRPSLVLTKLGKAFDNHAQKYGDKVTYSIEEFFKKLGIEGPEFQGDMKDKKEKEKAIVKDEIKVETAEEVEEDEAKEDIKEMILDLFVVSTITIGKEAYFFVKDDRGYWYYDEKTSEAILRTKIINFLDMYNVKTSDYQINTILNAIRGKTDVDEYSFDIVNSEGECTVVTPFKNGLYCDGKLINNFRGIWTYHLPYEYREISGNEVEQLLNKLSGYYPNIDDVLNIMALPFINRVQRKVVILYGPPRGGKDYLIEKILMSFVKITSLRPEVVTGDSRFELCGLWNFRAVYIGEVEYIGSKLATFLDNLSGGVLMKAECKNKAPIEMVFKGPVYLSANRLIIEDLPSGFYDRAEVVVFKNRFNAPKYILDESEKEVLINILIRRAQALSEKEEIHVGVNFDKFMESGSKCEEVIGLIKSGDKILSLRQIRDWLETTCAKFNLPLLMSDKELGKRLEELRVHKERGNLYTVDLPSDEEVRELFSDVEKES